MLRLLSRSVGRFRVKSADRDFAVRLRKMLGISPRNVELYKLAMVHRSVSHLLPKGKKFDNERLEYLGDAVLDAIVADYLFARYPEQNEGFLTKMRAKIVSRSSLNRLSERMGIATLVKMSNSTAETHKNINGNALEALIGAIFLDRGYEVASAVVVKNVLDRFINLEGLQTLDTDYKSKLIELGQKRKLPITFGTHEDANAHETNLPRFLSTLSVGGQEVAVGYGHSKKEAEQHASMIALERLGCCPEARSEDCTPAFDDGQEPCTLALPSRQNYRR